MAQAQIEETRGSNIYPASGPYPEANVPVRTPGELGHPEQLRRARPTAEALETAALVGARAIFGGYFVYNGINHFLNRELMTEYARAKGVRSPGAAVLLSGALIAAGGASILLGLKPKIGAGLISTFLVAVSPQMHAFWKERDPQPRMQEMVNFMKNFALVGASLFAAAHPEPWAWRASAGGGGEALMPLR